MLNVKRKSVNFSSGDLVEFGALRDDWAIPRVVRPGSKTLEPVEWAGANRDLITSELRTYGALLFRDFGINSIPTLRDFSAAISPNLVEYIERRSPRTELGDKVYTSTIHPSDQYIHFHNTTSFSHQWPMKLWFCCLVPAAEGGMTPIADTREVLNTLSPWVRDKFMEKGVMYVRNFYDGIGLSWQSTFQTSDRAGVEAFCGAANIEAEWIGGDRLRTRQVRHAVATHPETLDLVWFNQAHHFHVTSLEPDVTRVLLETYAEEDLPRNSYYGDGSPIEPEALHDIASAYEHARRAFPWEKGDVLMLDNMLVSHARTPYRGERLIALTLAELFSPVYDGGGVAGPDAAVDAVTIPLDD
jgi:alpha-ketoglutarate-dependent taurine dioxygenase